MKKTLIYLFTLIIFFQIVPPIYTSASTLSTTIRVGLNWGESTTTLNSDVSILCPIGFEIRDKNGILQWDALKNTPNKIVIGRKNHALQRTEIVVDGIVRFSAPRNDHIRIQPTTSIFKYKNPVFSGTKDAEGYTTYLGSCLLFWPSGSGTTDRIFVINNLAFEDYLRGVVGREMGSGSHIEALKAQAVCARTFAMSRLNSGMHKHNGFDIGCTTSDQVYGGNDNITSINNAVSQTAGKMMYYNNSLITAMYFSNTGGTVTEDNLYVNGNNYHPYLKSVDSSFETGGTNFTWTSTVSASTIEQYYANAGTPIGTLQDIVITRTPAGNVRQVDIKGTIRTITRTNSQCRSMGFVTTHSPRYSITKSGTTYTFNGRGWGHFVGMSQVGAMDMAKMPKYYSHIVTQNKNYALSNLPFGLFHILTNNGSETADSSKFSIITKDKIIETGNSTSGGYTYTEILKHYYTGIEIK